MELASFFTSARVRGTESAGLSAGCFLSQGIPSLALGKLLGNSLKCYWGFLSILYLLIHEYFELTALAMPWSVVSSARVLNDVSSSPCCCFCWLLWLLCSQGPPLWGPRASPSPRHSSCCNIVSRDTIVT